MTRSENYTSQVEEAKDLVINSI
ncbi:GbsR/MarR family transcriptional regulator, partial [Pseudomonas aeruginosa]